MKPIKEVYPVSEYYVDHGAGAYFTAPYDYSPLLESFGYKILLQVDDDDYQGDSRLIFKDDERYGLLIFGWGSCSGCDALQACGSYEEVEELRNELLNEIHWESGRSAMWAYTSEKDWELEWSYHSTGTKRFIDKALDLLKKETR